MTNIALVALGANKSWLGHPPAETLRRAAAALFRLGGEAELSPLYTSPAWPDPAEPSYVNAVLRFSVALSPEALLAALQATEAAFGRVRSEDPALRYAPRTLDLDFLALGKEMRESVVLELPHPRMASRDFVLLPLRDVAPGWRHPVTGMSADDMVRALPGVTAHRL